MFARILPIAIVVAAVVSPLAAQQENVGEMVPITASTDEASDDARVLYLEGVGAFRLGKMAESAEFFDRLIEVKPEDKPGLWERGIALYYAERFEECADQFVTHRTVNANDVENAAWHYLCVARLEGHEAARAGLFPHNDQRIPMREIWQMYKGEMTVEQVLEAAETRGELDANNRKLSKYYAHLYIGLWHESHGDVAKGLEHLKTGLVGMDGGHYMEMVGRAHVRLRTQQAATP